MTGLPVSFLILALVLAGGLGVLGVLKARSAAEAEREAQARVRMIEQLVDQNRLGGTKTETERDAARADAEKAAAAVTAARNELAAARDAAAKDRATALQREDKLTREQQKLERQKQDEADARTRQLPVPQDVERALRQRRAMLPAFLHARSGNNPKLLIEVNFRPHRIDHFI